MKKKNIFIKLFVLILSLSSFASCNASSKEDAKTPLVDNIFNSYTVTFKNRVSTNNDGSETKEVLLYETTVLEHQTAVYKGETPTNEDLYYTYTFSGWDKSLENILEDTVVYATYSKTDIYYNVTFHDGDGSVLETVKVKAGEEAFSTKTPTKNEGTSIWTFSGWQEDTTNVLQDKDIYPLFKETKTYLVTFLNGDGTILDEVRVEEGSNASTSKIPTKDRTINSDGSYDTYTFNGWQEDLTNINADLTVNPTWSVTHYYMVRYYDGDNSTILETKYVKEGDSTSTSKIPTKAATAGYEYSFSGWDKDASNVTSNLDIYPTFTESKRKYTVTFVLDGDKKSTSGNIYTERYEYESYVGSYKGSVSPYKEPEVSSDRETQRNYIFKYWTDKDDNEVNLATYSVRSDVTFYAYFELEETYVASDESKIRDYITQNGTETKINVGGNTYNYYLISTGNDNTLYYYLGYSEDESKFLLYSDGTINLNCGGSAKTTDLIYFFPFEFRKLSEGTGNALFYFDSKNGLNQYTFSLQSGDYFKNVSVANILTQSASTNYDIYLSYTGDFLINDLPAEQSRSVTSFISNWAQTQNLDTTNFSIYK